MTLALLIYTITAFSNMREVANALGGVSCFILTVGGFIYGLSFIEETATKFREAAKKILMCFLWILVSSYTIKILIPSERTSYMMVGGYFAENIAKSDQFNKSLNEAGNITGKLTNIINNKLDLYIKETENELTNSMEPKKPNTK